MVWHYEQPCVNLMEDNGIKAEHMLRDNDKIQNESLSPLHLQMSWWLYLTRSFVVTTVTNPSDAEPGIYRDNEASVMIVDTLTLCVGKTAHDDVIKWKLFPRYWPFVREIHRSPVNSPHKGQWRGALMCSLICALNIRLSKQSWGWWFETLSRSLWRHCNAAFMVLIICEKWAIVFPAWQKI